MLYICQCWIVGVSASVEGTAAWGLRAAHTHTSVYPSNGCVSKGVRHVNEHVRGVVLKLGTDSCSIW